MNYIILGVAVILIILMMFSNKKEGFREGIAPQGYCHSDHPGNPGWYLAKTTDTAGWGHGDYCWTPAGEKTAYGQKSCIGGGGRAGCLSACKNTSVNCSGVAAPPPPPPAKKLQINYIADGRSKNVKCPDGKNLTKAQCQGDAAASGRSWGGEAASGNRLPQGCWSHGRFVDSTGKGTGSANWWNTSGDPHNWSNDGTPNTYTKVCGGGSSSAPAAEAAKSSGEEWSLAASTRTCQGDGKTQITNAADCKKAALYLGVEHHQRAWLDDGVGPWGGTGKGWPHRPGLPKGCLTQRNMTSPPGNVKHRHLGTLYFNTTTAAGVGNDGEILATMPAICGAEKGASKAPPKAAGSVQGNIVTYNGYQYRTLHGFDPNGTNWRDGGATAISGHTSASAAAIRAAPGWKGRARCEGSFQAIPAGWAVAPDDAASLHVTKSYKWNTNFLVFSNDKALTTRDEGHDRGGLDLGRTLNMECKWRGADLEQYVRNRAPGSGELLGSTVPQCKTTKCDYAILLRRSVPKAPPPVDPTPKCPNGWDQVGDIGADVQDPASRTRGGTASYSKANIQQCSDWCRGLRTEGGEHESRCKAFIWAPLNGDKNHKDKRVCTGFWENEGTSPTDLNEHLYPGGAVSNRKHQAVDGSFKQIFCKPTPAPPPAMPPSPPAAPLLAPPLPAPAPRPLPPPIKREKLPNVEIAPVSNWCRALDGPLVDDPSPQKSAPWLNLEPPPQSPPPVPTPEPLPVAKATPAAESSGERYSIASVDEPRTSVPKTCQEDGKTEITTKEECMAAAKEMRWYGSTSAPGSGGFKRWKGLGFSLTDWGGILHPSAGYPKGCFTGGGTPTVVHWNTHETGCGVGRTACMAGAAAGAGNLAICKNGSAAEAAAAPAAVAPAAVAPAAVAPAAVAPAAAPVPKAPTKPACPECGNVAIESAQFPGSYLDAGGNRKVWTAQKPYSANNYRKWNIIDIGDGKRAIESLQFPGSYLDAGGDRKVWTAQKSYNANNYRKWKINDIGGGKVAIESLQFPKSYLDAGGNRKVHSAGPYGSLGAATQNNFRKWSIIKI